MSAEALDSSFCLPIGKAKVWFSDPGKLTVRRCYFSTYVLGQCPIFLCLKIIHCRQIEREGKDVTITAFSKMVGLALKVRNLCFLLSFWCHEIWFSCTEIWSVVGKLIRRKGINDRCCFITELNAGILQLEGRKILVESDIWNFCMSSYL